MWKGVTHPPHSTETCKINGKAAKVQVFTKDVHGDIYCDYCVLTATGVSLPLTVSINSVERVYTDTNDLETVGEYDLVAMTLFKDDESLISSYVEHHRTLGVQRFFMYYNGTKDIDSLPQMPDVVYVPWRYPYMISSNKIGMHYAQIGAMTDFLHNAKHFSKYVLYNDLDEFISWSNADVSLAQYVIDNDESCYGFRNLFVTLPDEHNFPSDRLHVFIREGRFTKSEKIWDFGERSKCIVKAADVDSMGVHKVISPRGIKAHVMNADTSVLLHVALMKGRQHVTVTPRTFSPLPLKGAVAKA